MSPGNLQYEVLEVIPNGNSITWTATIEEEPESSYHKEIANALEYIKLFLA